MRFLATVADIRRIVSFYSFSYDREQKSKLIEHTLPGIL
jgi:hypothetical protein